MLAIHEKLPQHKSELGLGFPKSCLTLIGLSEDTEIKLSQDKVDILTRLSKIFLFAITSLEDFTVRKLELFDPHVGETACHIRAHLVQELDILYNLDGTRGDVIQYYRQLFVKKYEILELLLNSQPVFKNKVITLTTLLQEANCFFYIPSDVIFLILSRFLNTFNINSEEAIPFTINLQSVRDFFPFSNYQAKKLVKYIQRLLSRYSYKFIEYISQFHSVFGDQKNFLRYHKRIADNKRIVIPAFTAMDIILSHIKLRKRYMCVKHHLHSQDGHSLLLFIFKGTGKEILLQELLDTNTEQPVYVFRSVSHRLDLSQEEALKALKSKMNVIGIENIILANLAAHPQFSGEELKAFKYKMPFDYEGSTLLKESHARSYNEKFQNFMKRAHQEGCSIQNKQLMFFRHVYSQTISLVTDASKEVLLY